MSGLRRGKWTPEEELYVNAVIYRFNQGTLPVPAGTTLRTYLSEKINEGLLELEIRWKRKMASMQRESDRKAQRAVVLPPNIPAHLASTSRSAVDMAKTANWLSRANEMLTATKNLSETTDDILNLAETRGLITEGETLKRSRNEQNNRSTKNARHNNSLDLSTANDAMALFGFMQSVACSNNPPTTNGAGSGGRVAPAQAPPSMVPASSSTSASTSSESLSTATNINEDRAIRDKAPSPPEQKSNAKFSPDPPE
ncbi:hypothetical protein TrRE_jg4354 [Triparma retinervis]|uniref:Uncharacterized protein n=1 Tax=Triparma retinervis TaxID=2557542 RepID=A0A9W7KUL1_9STRA|nr:hypothetical protein TrRE_jg4354 [Triparma retinervis]